VIIGVLLLAMDFPSVCSIRPERLEVRFRHHPRLDLGEKVTDPVDVDGSPSGTVPTTLHPLRRRNSESYDPS
jgi:hypothetical protein